MSATDKQGADSKIAKAYDEAIARAQVLPDEEDVQGSDVQGTTTAAAAHDPGSVGGVVGADQEAADTDLGPGEEIRDREFPAPTQPLGAGSEKLVINQDTLPKDESRRGRPPGEIDGDVQKASEVPSILDQDAVTPDLASEQG